MMSTNVQSENTVRYLVEIIHPSTHYAQVTLELENVSEKRISLKMPVWTPGSYMIREFERNIDRVSAVSESNSLPVKKSDKNTWVIDNKEGRKHITVTYRVYCFENTVRTSYIDADHAFLLPTSLLLFSDPGAQGSIEFKYPSTWGNISTTLNELSKNKYSFINYDDIADSPVEIGNHEILGFEVAGIPHKVALVGRNNCPSEKFISDLKKVCQAMYEVMEVHPCKEYLFIIHHVEEGGGGLEHANSSVVQMQRFSYTSREKYLSFLSLCAHEYFHLWNVKRIRPEALGPFDYSRENHSNLLWVAEGITSYYDELVMYRAGFRTESEYLRILSGTVTSTLNRKGAGIQSLHEASFDAWIKEYRPNENSINTGISYYMKGAVVAAMLDIEILSATKGKKGLDHLMRYLYEEFYMGKKRGFSDDEFYASVDKVAGRPLNFRHWAEDPNNGETNEHISSVLKKVACSIQNRAQSNPWYTGINTELKGEKVMVRSVEAMSPAYATDIQAGDEILAINGIRVKGNIDDALRQGNKGEQAEFLLSRAGMIRTVVIKPLESPLLDLQITIDKGDDPLLRVWLKKKED